VAGSELALRAGRRVLLFGAAIQTACEREASAGSTLHDKGLQVLQTKCHDDSADKFLCEVTFVSKSDPTERLYFDIVAVAAQATAGNSRADYASADAPGSA
jgi:hypothetical protein